MAKDKKGTNRGRIVSIRGPVLDIEFPPGKLPDMYTSLEIPRSKEKKKDYQRALSDAKEAAKLKPAEKKYDDLLYEIKSAADQQ